MTFSQLVPTPATVREWEPNVFSEMTDAEIETAKANVIRDAIAADLADALGVTTTISTTTLDDVAAKFETDLRRAASVKFLELWFRENDAGDGSITRTKSIAYGQDYDRLRAAFRRFGLATSTNSIPLYR